MLSPGREHDIRILEDLLNKAKSPSEREKWKHKIRQILNESNHKDVMDARAKLIDATRRGNLKEIEAVTDELHRIGRKNGTSK